MTLSKYKSTPKGAGQKVADLFKSTRKKEPSDRLVKIISEIKPTEPEKMPKKDERAAKDLDV